jgi:hypothetical protein
MIVAALAASTAVFAADIAKERFDEARIVYANLGVAAPAPSEYGDTLELAPSVRFRIAADFESDVTYDSRWRLPEAFGYHPSTFDAAESKPAPAGDSRFRDDRPPRKGRGAPRVQF